MATTPHLVMLGPAAGTRGDIAAVLECYRAQGLFRRWSIDYVATHGDDGVWRNAGRALSALRELAGLLTRSRRVAVHLHTAAGRGFWRDALFMALALAARYPLILHLHGAGYEQLRDDAGPLGQRLIGYLLERAACVVVPCESLRAWVDRVTRRAQVICLANPVTPAEVAPEARRPNLVLFLSRLDAANGLLALLAGGGGRGGARGPGRAAGVGGRGRPRRFRAARREARHPRRRHFHRLGRPLGQARAARERSGVRPSAVQRNASRKPARSDGRGSSGGGLVGRRRPGDGRGGCNRLSRAPRRRRDAPAAAAQAPARPGARHAHRSGCAPIGPASLRAGARAGQPRGALRRAGVAGLRRCASAACAGGSRRGGMKRPVVLVLGPSREAISGVSTHVGLLLDSALAREFRLVHFQVGSEGREEGAVAKLWRLFASPFQLAAAIVRSNAALVHVNTSLDARGYLRDLVYLAVAKLLGARVVYQLHDNLFRVLGKPRLAFAPALDLVARWPDAVVLLSEREAEAWRARGGAPALHVVPNGIDCAPYLRHSRAAPDPAAPLRLICIGRLAPRKGLLESIEAVRLVRERGI